MKTARGPRQLCSVGKGSPEFYITPDYRKLRGERGRRRSLCVVSDNEKDSIRSAPGRSALQDAETVDRSIADRMR